MIASGYITEVGLKRDSVPCFDTYPFSLAAVRPLERLELHPAVTFFVGENGSGKSTLLEAIAVACGFNAEGGSKNFRFETRGSHSELHRFIRIARGIRRPRDGFFLRAESFFNVATEIEKRKLRIGQKRLRNPPKMGPEPCTAVERHSAAVILCCRPVVAAVVIGQCGGSRHTRGAGRVALPTTQQLYARLGLQFEQRDTLR